MAVTRYAKCYISRVSIEARLAIANKAKAKGKTVCEGMRRFGL